MIISWIASFLILAGNVLVIGKDWRSFLIFMLGNGLFAYYWFIRKEWATFLLVCIFFIQNIYGLIKWRNEYKIDQNFKSFF